MPPRGQRAKRSADDEENAAPAAAATKSVAPVAAAATSEATEVRQRRTEGATAAPSHAADDEWEDVPTTSDDDDDDDVDERFEGDDDEEIVDEGGDDGSDADSNADIGEIRQQLRRVHFDPATGSVVPAAEGGPLPVEDDDDDDDAAQVWRRDQDKESAKGPLMYNNKAYDCFFQLKSEYPCLSFDILRDPDGDTRTKYPLGMYLVCGSQAPNPGDNMLYIIKVTNLLKTKHDLGSDEDSEDDDEVFGAEEDEDEDDDEDIEEELNGGEPIVDYKTVKHHGTVNRLRCNPHNPTMVLTWSDTGRVQVFDVASEMRSMSDFAGWSKDQAAAASSGKKPRSALRFVSAADTHSAEGYGLAWSTMQPNVFATGDCAGALIVWKPTDDGRWLPTASHPSTHRTGSIEEIKFSPTQPDVLICARAGGKIEVWDARSMSKPRVSWRADPTDINVCDWNKTATSSHLLVSGADSGVVAVWDLRSVQQAVPQPLQSLTFHEGNKITSVEFSHHNESVLSVTSDDGQCTLWDLSLERDPDEEAEVMGSLFGRKDTVDLPDQLMFQHQGLEHPKEAHFHAQIPGMTITTDFHGLHIFKPMNWRSLMK